MQRNEELLLAVLNSAPVVAGRVTDHLDGESGRQFARSWGGAGTTDEMEHLRHARNALHSVIRGDESAVTHEIAAIMDGVVRTPRVTEDGIHWELRTPDDARLAVDVVLAWSSVSAEFPGRLRACANDECHLFLIDHSRPGTAKWCSMATCGNRMKARAHATRSRG